MKISTASLTLSYRLPGKPSKVRVAGEIYKIGDLFYLVVGPRSSSGIRDPGSAHGVLERATEVWLDSHVVNADGFRDNVLPNLMRISRSALNTLRKTD